MKHFLTMLMITLFLTFSTVALAAPSYPIYLDTKEQWMVATTTLPMYTSLENAQRSIACEQKTHADFEYQVLSREGKWLIVEDHDEGKLWVEAATFVDLATFLQNKPLTSDDSCNEGTPKSFRVDLDASHKKAQILIQKYPVLMGAGGIIEVWDSQKTTLLWHSEALNMTNAYDNILCCSSHIGGQWIQLVADVNNDGNAEISIKYAQSEIGAGQFYILQWNGKAFVPLDKGSAFLLLGEQELKKFTAVENLPEADIKAFFIDLFNGQYRTWVNDFIKRNSDGTVTVSVQMLGTGKSGSMESGDGLAQMRLDKNWDLAFVKWESDPTIQSTE